MSSLNKNINWKPKSTGTKRFGNWLENANDWNLSRSRFWGIPGRFWPAGAALKSRTSGLERLLRVMTR